MIVVSDTSPLTNLAAVGYFYLLEQIYSNIVIAQAVFDEIVTSQPGTPVRLKFSKPVGLR